MALLDAIAETAGEAFDRQLRNPGPEPERDFSTTSFLLDGTMGVPTAVMQAIGSLTDPLAGLDQAFEAMSSTPLAAAAGMGGMLPTTGQREQIEAARQRSLQDSSARIPVGTQLRRHAQEFAPDPLTSHKANLIVHDLVRYGGKAAASVMTLGPAGAVVFGLEEGNTVAQTLREEGVDTATAAKVGAVQGSIGALGAVLPIGGKTIAQTLGLVAIGGPGSYIAQEQLSKDILQKAGHNDLASLHNPFDPLGLALSTVIPGAFGALHMRGTANRAEAVAGGRVPIDQLKPEEVRGLKYDDPRLDAVAVQAAEANGIPPAVLLAIKNVGEKSGPTAVSPRGAQGVMQFMPGTAKEMGLADRTDPVASIHAAARYMKKLYDAYGSLDAAVAHYNGGGTQAVIVRGGGRPSYNETAGYLDRVRKYVADHTAETAAKDPANVDAARVAVLNDTLAKSLPDTPDAVAQVMRAADIVGERGGRAAQQEVPEPMVTVYHGTLHKFDTFDSAHIGKGEGMQAFGHGIYLAEKERVASHYRDMLAREPDAPGSIKNSASREIVNQWVDEAGGDRRKAAQAYSAFAKEAGLDKSDPQLYLETLDRIENPPGFTYRAEIPQSMADKMIDLDAPIEQAPKVVQDYFREHGAYKPGLPMSEHMAIDKFAAAKFSAAGIPGIRYLDGTSRGAGEGSRNYVIFPGHESEIRMGARNGEPLEIASLQENGNAQTNPTGQARAAVDPVRQGATAADRAESSARAEVASNALPEAHSVTIEPETGTKAASSETKPGPAGSIDQQIAQKLATEQPDLRVVLPGSDEPISIATALERIAQTQKQDEHWALLLKVATDCALGR